MRVLSLAFICLVGMSCGSDVPLEVPAQAPSPRNLQLSAELPEEEVFGRVFKFGEHATLSDGPYEVRLVPLGETTMPSGDARRMLVDPATGSDATDWGWYDALTGDGENKIGGIDVCDGPEVHRQYDVVNNRVLAPAAGGEVHCIDPGRYRIELYDLEDNELVSSREIDYLGVSRVGFELIEVPNFGRDFSALDNIQHFDISMGLSPSVNPAIAPVVPDPNRAGYYRFNASATTTGWNKDLRGKVSVRWIWNLLFPSIRSGFTNTRDASGDVHRLQLFSGSGTRQARAEFITPHVSFWTGSTPVTKRDISFNITPPDTVVASLRIEPGDSIRMMRRDTLDLTAFALNAGGQSLTNVSIDWSTISGVVSLQEFGHSARVTSNNVSSTTIRAVSATQRDSVYVKFEDELCRVFSIDDDPLDPGFTASVFWRKIIQALICAHYVTPNQEYSVDFGDGTDTGWIGSLTEEVIVEHVYEDTGMHQLIINTRDTEAPGTVYADTFEVMVEGPNIASISVSPSSSSLNPGQTVRLTATPRDENGAAVSGVNVTWSSTNSSVSVTPVSSNPNKADVRSQVIANATIRASIDAVSGTASVQFSPPSCPSIHHVDVVVSDGLINVGETSDLQAIPKDVSGNSLSTTGCTISWSSSSHLSVSQSGQYPYLATATGASAGTGTVTASVNGIQGSNQITVGSPPAGDNARPYGVGNSFPPTMYQNQFYAVSVYMENTGGTTWSSPDYTLKLVSGTGFEPTSVQLPQSVAPGTNYPIGFSLYANAPWGQKYNVQYQMRRAGSGAFGQTNGDSIDVLDPAGCTKNCGPTAFYGPIPEAYPGGSLNGDVRPRFSSSVGSNGILQSLVVEDYPLYFFDDDGLRVAYIRYFGSLAEPWSVDVTFRLRFDPGTIHIGQLKKALSLTGYDLDILTLNASELVVKLKRQSPGSALPDEQIIFLEIPLLAVPGTTPPTTLPRVELVVER